MAHEVGVFPLRPMDSPAKVTPICMWTEARKHFRTKDDRRQSVRTPEYRQGIAESKEAILSWEFSLKNKTPPGPDICRFSARSEH